MNIILASQSPRRHALLQKITTDFTVLPSDADETLPDGIAPDAAVTMLAHKKAAAVAALPDCAGCCVIGADTVVVIDGLILGKPADRDEAVAMMRRLSGRTHTVYTGMAVLTPEHPPLCSVTATQVTFYPLDEREIADYVDTGDPYDKAGGYGIQSRAGLLVQSVAGDYYNVIGLPIAPLSRQLQQLGVIQIPAKV